MTGLIVRYIAADSSGCQKYYMRIFTVAEQDAAEFREMRGRAYELAVRDIKRSEASQGRRYWKTEKVV